MHRHVGYISRRCNPSALFEDRNSYFLLNVGTRFQLRKGIEILGVVWPLNDLKRLEVFISYSQSEHSNFVRAELTKFADAIQNCSLTQLCITAFCIKKRFRVGLDEFFDQALAPLEAVRGLQELSLTEDLDSRKRGPNSYNSRVVGTKEYRERLRGMLTSS